MRHHRRGRVLNASSLALCLLALFVSGIRESEAAAYSLFIQSGTVTVNGAGGATLDAWGYTTANGAPPMVPGPVIESHENETVTVTVYNNHSQPHNFVVPGLTNDTTPIPPGGSRQYSFTTQSAGVYLYTDTLASNVNREMGMYGALVVRAASGASVAWTGGPSYDLERLWVVSDMDKSGWNDVAGTGGIVNTSVYKPNYFLINGEGGFDGLRDPNSQISGAVGQTALVRMVNAGQFDESLHFHSNHFRIIYADGVQDTSPEWSDTINLKAGHTAMVLFQLNHAGQFPMHVHTAQMETANGVYLNGVATMIIGN